MSTVLLDTNILIDYLRASEEAALYLESLRGKPAASVVSVLEVVVGAKNRREEERIAGLEQVLQLLPVTLPIARRAGVFFKHYAASHATDSLDALIAATAEHHGLKLATLNTKHFPMFPKLKRAY